MEPHRPQGNDKFTMCPREPARPIAAPIDRITFLITGEQTGGALFMAEVSIAPGGGNPPHIHRREEEMFYLQQGTLTIQVGERILNASPGDFVRLPSGVAHCFKNNGNVDAKVLLVVTR